MELAPTEKLLPHFAGYTKSYTGGKYSLHFDPCDLLSSAAKEEGLPHGYYIRCDKHGLLTPRLDMTRLEGAVREGFKAIGVETPDLRRVVDQGVPRLFVSAATLEAMRPHFEAVRTPAHPENTYQDFAQDFSAYLGQRARGR